MEVTFTPEQEAEILQWITWLEETTLPQTKGALKRKVEGVKDFAYCCLGIYAEHRHPECFSGYPTHEWGKFTFRLPEEQYEGEATTMVLPDPISEDVLGIGQRISETNHSLQMQLVNMNDSLEYSFKEIVIELRHLLEHKCWTEETTSKLRYKGQH